MSVNEEFIRWLSDEMESRSWSQGEMARRSGMSQALVSLLLLGKSAPGLDSLHGIARAFKMRKEDVFRKAGYLDPLPGDDLALTELQYLIPRLPTNARARVLEYVRFVDQRRPVYAVRENGTDYEEEVAALFHRLPASQQEAILALLRSLVE